MRNVLAARSIRIALPSLTVACLMALAPSAQAQAPAAIVEHVDSKTAGVEIMDYLLPGKTIGLAAGERLVLGYLKSCWQETITGGTVKIGAEQSEVANGKVERLKVGCDARHMTLTSAQAKTSGAMAFRKGPQKGAPEPELTLYGLSPVVEAKAAGRLVIERLDTKGERFEFELKGPQLLRGAFFDLAKADKALSPGGIYRASMGERQLVFKVDALAKPGSGPVIGRLLRLSPTV
jgi:hypothetical protein